MTMNDSLSLVRTNTLMETILDILDYENFGAIFVLLGLLFVIGSMMARENGLVLLWSARAGAAAMLMHATLMWIDRPPGDAYAIARIVFRAIVTGALVAVSGWTLIAVGLFLYERFVAAPAQRFRAWADRSRRVHDEAVRAREADRQSREAEQEWRRGAPDRARQQQMAEEQANRVQAQQRQREAARLDCELFFAFHAVDIAQRFSRADFDRFLRNYLNDQLTADEVLTRATQVRATIAQHAEKVHPPPAVQCIADLTTWYQARKAEADAVANERLRRVLLAQLNERYTELTTRFLQEIQV